MAISWLAPFPLDSCMYAGCMFGFLGIMSIFNVNVNRSTQPSFKIVLFQWQPKVLLPKKKRFFPLDHHYRRDFLNHKTRIFNRSRQGTVFVAYVFMNRHSCIPKSRTLNENQWLLEESHSTLPALAVPLISLTAQTLRACLNMNKKTKTLLILSYFQLINKQVLLQCGLLLSLFSAT